MAELTEREMLLQLIDKVDHISDKQDKMKVKQDDMDLRFNNVEIELCGTSLEPERGIVSRVRQNEKCIVKIKKEQFKLYTWALVLVAAINAAFIGLKALVSFIKG